VALPELPGDGVVIGGDSQEGTSSDLLLRVLTIPVPFRRGDFKIKFLSSSSARPSPKEGFFQEIPYYIVAPLDLQ
jgi:hypothetical protein